MASAREQYLQAMASLTEMTRTRAERLASRLAKQGDLQSGQVGRFAEDLVRRTQRNRETMSRLIQREVKRQLSVLGIATRDEVARLQQRVRALEQAVERPAAGAGRRAAAGTATSRSRTSRAAASKDSTSGSAPRSAGGTTTRGSASAGGRRASGAGAGQPAGGSGSARGTRRRSPRDGQETSQGE